jgi:2-succinyl-5-enolpyruvyl-6-hydroxy-3-cyclohexene-1-carboxylate synthase
VVSSIKGVHELVELCKLHGVQHVVVSPGSRNAPLSITLENTNGIATYVVVDERSAAFFALGISLALNQPVAIVCTSGSAALNYAPAISEAYYQKIPLIVITADRPHEWINQADGQTIMQHGIYGNHILHSVTLPVIENEDTAWLHNRLINEAFLKANGKIKGPVHINVPFKEPLYKTIDTPTHSVRKITSISAQSKIADDDLNMLVKLINDSEKVLLLVGQQKYQASFNELLANLTLNNQCIVLSETTSNIWGDGIITTIDRVIDGFNGIEKLDFAPEILITFGDAIVSKKVKSWLRSHQPKNHFHIGEEHNIIDTYACLTYNVSADACTVLGQINEKIKSGNSAYRKLWIDRNNKIKAKQKEFLAKTVWSDLKMFEIILGTLPGCELHLGNSSPIRYVQLFDMNPGIHYHSNRGTSGIDGCSSTAAGFSVASDKLNVLITGDISFYYDSNALWNKYIKGNFKIILVNNKGGNIFRIIDGPSENDLTEKYFEAKQDMNAEHICRQFQVSYLKASNEKELTSLLPGFFKEGIRPTVLEVFTDNIDSPQILKDYFSYLKT